ncbi:MAG: S8 family peptidase [Bacteroidetes bacterium]|nr:S8 family peptidase [Bacteroidota bacterium]
MKKSIPILLFIFMIPAILVAQGTHKLNFHLAKMIADETLQQKQINLLVQGNVEAIREIAELNGGLFRYSHGNIATIRIPVSAISVLAASEQVGRIENPGSNYTTMNDTMRSVVQANAVHAGISPLLQGYNGTGIAIGIIDTGVDLTHPDLQDTSGATRVQYLWDQRKPVAANTPAAYGYGQEWNKTDIDAGLASSSNDAQGFGHGTHVTGISVGDGSANGKNKGVAPGADIIEVAFDFNNVTDPTYIDAVDYIFNRAAILGKPCVINASLGDYYGSHDGYDLQSQMISTLLNQQAGRVMVAAAGNAGSLPFHLGYNVTTDTSFTWVRHNPAYSALFFQVWGDTADFKNIDYTIGADKNSTSASFRGKLNYRDIFYNLGVFKQDTLFSTSGNRLAIIQSFGSTQGPTYLLEINIIPDSATYQWRLMTTGSGKLDIWKFYDGTGQSGFVNTALPSAAIVPEIVYYKLPDSLSTIVSGFQCLDNVITVGNYGNRSNYVDINGNTYTDATVTPGEIALNSSWGPTRDGRIKPDIAAPGGLMLSCGQLSLLTIWATQPSNAPKIAQGGFHFRDGGTSSSSPVVAGIAALYLQQNPTATAMQVKNAIINCAVQDNFTGFNLPDVTWGYGKANAFNTLVNCSLTSLGDVTENTSMSLFPNPVFSGEMITISLNEKEDLAYDLSLIDQLGRTVKAFNNINEFPFTFSTKNIATGSYQLKLTDKNKKQIVKKLVITE